MHCSSNCASTFWTIVCYPRSPTLQERKLFNDTENSTYYTYIFSVLFPKDGLMIRIACDILTPVGIHEELIDQKYWPVLIFGFLGDNYTGVIGYINSEYDMNICCCFYLTDYSIVPSSEMSVSVCLFVCLFVYMCRLPWPDHSRLRSENSLNDWKFTEEEHITNFIPSDTMRHNYATFQESTTFDISILNFKVRMDG